MYDDKDDEYKLSDTKRVREVSSSFSSIEKFKQPIHFKKTIETDNDRARNAIYSISTNRLDE